MTKAIRISLTEELHQAIKRLAKERGQSMAYLMREASAAYLERSNVRVKDVHPEWGGYRGEQDEGDDEPDAAAFR